jgi:hypothetical protein
VAPVPAAIDFSWIFRYQRGSNRSFCSISVRCTVPNLLGASGRFVLIPVLRFFRQNPQSDPFAICHLCLVSLSAASDSLNLNLEATDATFSIGALELVAVSHSSVMGSVPILDVKIIYHIEGSIATPYAIANASVAIPSVLHEIGSRQCLKSTETCASPLLSISGSHLKGFEALTGRVYVSRIDMPQHVCVKEFICPKVKQVIISLRTPSSGPVSRTRPFSFSFHFDRISLCFLSSRCIWCYSKLQQ